MYLPSLAIQRGNHKVVELLIGIGANAHLANKVRELYYMNSSTYVETVEWRDKFTVSRGRDLQRDAARLQPLVSKEVFASLPLRDWSAAAI